ncbi:glycoside hydrolase family 3 N-terminal domain-containing protein [Porticoccaceae bacterium]|nr:glycoside hydrolase family 3 N-terminal domain-containing protein [Porticoccaceae bacterium]
MATNISYWNANLPAEKRVELLLAEMTLDEKIGQMCQFVGEASDIDFDSKDTKSNYTLALGARAGLIKQGKIGSFLKVSTFEEANVLQELAEQSRLKIPLLIATDAIHGHGMYMGATTIYATQIGLAASFEPELAERVAQYTASEMRATGFNWAYSPNVEVVRDARWGRIGETFGEDPYLVTEMGNAMVRGYQGKDFSSPTNVLASAKHFVGGGIAYNGVNGAPADVSERTLHEIFFPPFIGSIDNGVYTIMPAHNEINGIPAHAHEEYLTDLIRGEWGFEGFYISDWMDIQRLESAHKIVDSEREADKVAVLAGMDVHMQGPGFFDNVKALVENGEIPLSRIDHAVSKILYAKFQLGLFENRYTTQQAVDDTLLSDSHRALALTTAQKSMVLLKNNGVLPLSQDIERIVVTGPNADHQALLGEWARVQPDNNVITVLEGIEQQYGQDTAIDYAAIAKHHHISDSELSTAGQLAENADVVIAVMGENSLRFDQHKTSAENVDRPTLDLVGNQIELLKKIKASGSKLVVVLVNGGPIASEWLTEHADAILEAWEPGMYGGQAIAETLVGKINPAGRLPITVPRSVGHLQSFYNHKPSAFHRGGFYLSRRAPLYYFGYGLSYTQFDYSNLIVPKTMSTEGSLSVSVDIKNIGAMDGDEVVLLYINDKVSSVTTPVKKLVAFKRLHLKRGERKTISFTIDNKDFALLDRHMKSVVEPGEFDIIIGDHTKVATVDVQD